MRVGNVLGLALGVIGRTPGAQLARFTGSTENAAGYTENAYAAPVVLAGNVQPVDRKLYRDLGLDLARDYVTVYTPDDVTPTGRDHAGDRILWGGATWQCESVMDWRTQAGWKAVTAVKVPA